MTARKTKFLKFVSKYRLFFNCLLLACLFFVNCFWGNMIYVVYPVLLLMVVLDNQRNGFTYLVFTIPFCTLKLYLSAILFFVAIVAYIIKFYIILYIKERTKPNILLIVSICVLFLYIALPIGPYSLNKLIKFSMLFFLFAIFGMIIKKPNILRGKLNVRVFVCALLVSCAFSACWYISPYLREVTPIMWVGGQVRWVRYQALLMQPNVLAMACEIFASIFAYYIISKRAKFVDWLCLFALTVLGMFTFSKTFLILICFIYVCILLYFLITHFVSTLVVGSIAICTLVIIGLNHMNIVMMFLNRFGSKFSEITKFSDFMNMVTTGRYALWLEYLIYMAQNPMTLMFGAGLGAAPLSTFSAHNLFISMVYELGLVGGLILLAVVVIMIAEFIKNSKAKPTWAISVPVIVLFALMCVEDLIFYIYL